MKNFVYVLLLMSFISFTSCSETTNDEDAGVSLVNVSKSDCKPIRTKARASSPFGDETVECQALGNGRLVIAHNNSIFGCDDRVKTSLENHKDVIYLKEKQETSRVNCVCPYDFTYTVSGLKNGQNYVLIIKSGSEEICKMSFQYNSSLKLHYFVEK